MVRDFCRPYAVSRAVGGLRCDQLTGDIQAVRVFRAIWDILSKRDARDQLTGLTDTPKDAFVPPNPAAIRCASATFEW